MADTLGKLTRFHVLTIFPEMFVSPFAESIMARAIQNKLIDIRTHDIRNYATDRHRTVDDYPFGGGRGMLMKAEPLFDAVDAVRSTTDLDDDSPVILLSPPGPHSYSAGGGGTVTAQRHGVALRPLRRGR